MVHAFSQRDRDRHRRKVRNHFLVWRPKGRGGTDGCTAIPSLLFSSQGLGHACTWTSVAFKPLGPGLQLQSALWEFNEVTASPSAGSRKQISCWVHYVELLGNHDLFLQRKNVHDFLDLIFNLCKQVSCDSVNFSHFG